VLRRQADVNGKKHPKEFKGTDEELNAVVSWILSQKKKTSSSRPGDESPGQGQGLEMSWR